MDNTIRVDNKIATLNLVPGRRYFDEEIIVVNKKEYRVWDPFRSKLSAAIAKGIKNIPINSKSRILYLGAAHGYTVSFLSDIVRNGIIYALEFSDRCFYDLLPICKKRKNIAPVFADARMPEQYSWIEEVDVVFCDIAQPDQTDIAIRNCVFLKKGGFLLLSVKTKSIDVTKSSKKVCREEMEKLKNSNFEIIDWKMLEPFEKNHCFIVAEKR